MASKTLFISAGEVSGDRHGARVVDAIKALHPDTRFIGIGGDAMAKSGVELLCDITTNSAVGIFEPIKHLKPLLIAMGKARKALSSGSVDAFVPIDSQGFHMPLAKLAHKLGIPTIYYIAPQDWQWGTKKGVHNVINYCDKILCIFKEEFDVYKTLTTKARYVGHPITDIAPPPHITSAEKNALTLFPGSRSQELAHTAPLLCLAAKIIQEKFPNLPIRISVVNPIHRTKIEKMVKKAQLNATLSTAPSLELIAGSTLSLSCSGTITLEHAMLKTPIIAAFKWHPISYWIIWKLVGKKWMKNVSYISLPNILQKREIMPEFLQKAATAEAIASSAIEILETPEKRDTIVNEFTALKEKLGHSGTANRAAAEICETLYNGDSNE